MNKVNASIDWKPVQKMLIKFYETGKSKEGERAYSPLLLFKCMLLQKWFQINSVLLKQFYQQGISINKGVAVDARLVKSASRPISNELIEQLKQKLDTPESKLDKNGNIKKFARDNESNWTVNLKVTRKNEKPHYGFKEHASVDTDHGFILSTHLTPASHHDSPYFPRAIIHSMHTDEKIEKGFGDKGYDGLPKTIAGKYS